MASIFCVQMYCDGSCLANPGPGGWAALLMWQPTTTETSTKNVQPGWGTNNLAKNHSKLLCGHERHTTNNRMELTAAIEGLSALKCPCGVQVFCDSQYVVKGITEWVSSWKKRGWKTAAGKPVENQDLWQKLLTTSEQHKVTWRWVKAHAGNTLNEYVDEQARAQAHLASGS